MVAAAYRRWSFTRGSNRKALTGKVLVFKISSGHPVYYGHRTTSQIVSCLLYSVSAKLTCI